MNRYISLLVLISFSLSLGCSEECDSDADCESGYLCADAKCEPLDELVCEAGVISCDGESTLVRCNADGTEREMIACGEMEVCVSGDIDASCQAQVCEPGAIGCEDENTVSICDRTGVERMLLPCGEGTYCAEGSCRAQVCEPSSQSCDGAIVVACDALGSSQTVTSCSDGCASDVGCGCDSGACYERSCQPGSARCEGSSVQVCEEDGRGYGAPMACGDEEVCVQGSCVSSTCEAGTQICAGDVVLTCSENGIERTEESCSARDEICVEAGGVAMCQSRVCVPNSQTCAPGEEVVLSCDARGAVEMRSSCQARTFCRDGACVDALCSVEDGLSCIDGDVKRCNARGSEYVLVQDCTEEERCRDGACVPLTCEAGDVSCSGETLLTCSADGLTLERQNCAEENAYCDSVMLACVSQSCAPGALYCEGDVLMQCDNRGSSAMMTAECVLGCEAGACVEGCGDGIVQEGEECDGGEGCDETCVFEETAPCAQSAVGCPILDFVMITGGMFEMGSTTSPNEQPVHSVTMSNFEIMQTEVTVAQYKTCVDAGVCTRPRTGTDFNWAVLGRENHPVNGVSWVQMQAFATWVGARLPSEAEWEYAARSEGQNITYPWGNAIPTCSYADFRDGEQCNGVGTSPVCNTPDGNTTQGLCDMAGNVFEWTQDNWHDTYNGAPIDGSAWCDREGCENNNANRVYRGGDWFIGGGTSSLRAAFRVHNDPSVQSNRIGARLSRSIP